MRNKRTFLTAVLTTIAVSSSAWAQPTAEQQRERGRLIDQAQQAADRNNHARAIELINQAGAISMTPSLRMFLAEEQIANHTVVEGLNSAHQCATDAESDRNLPDRRVILQTCRELEQRANTAVARVNIRLPLPLPAGLQVSVSGHTLTPVELATAWLANPGPVVVEATAPSFQRFHRELTVAEGSTSEVRIELTADITAPPPNIGPPTTTTTTSRGVHPGPIIVAGVGAVSLILSGVFYGLRQNEVAQLEMLCNGPDQVFCDNSDTARQHFSAADSMNTATNVTLIGGAVVLAGGITWLIVSQVTSRPNTERRVQLIPVISPANATMGFQGSF